MGIKKSKSYRKKPERVDYKRNINRAIDSNTMDNVPFVYALQVNAGQFRNLTSVLPYTVPQGKKFMITFMSLSGDVANDTAIYLNGQTLIYVRAGQSPLATSLTQPIEVFEGQIISKSPVAAQACVAGFEIEA